MKNYFALIILATLLGPATAFAQSLVQDQVGTSTANATTVTITVTATGANNLLVVGTGNTSTRTVTSVSDGTNNFLPVPNNAQCTGVHCVDMWYLPRSAAGVTTITITFSGAAGTFMKTGFFWEVSGFTDPKPTWSYATTGSNGTGYSAHGFNCGGVGTCFLPVMMMRSSGTVVITATNEFDAAGEGGLQNSNQTMAMASRIAAFAGSDNWTTTGGTVAWVGNMAQFTDIPAGYRAVSRNSVSSTALTNTVTIPATTAGDLLVIAAGNNQGRTITSISDGTNTYTQASGAEATNGVYKSDMWYALSTAAGITSVTVTYSGVVDATVVYKDVWAWQIQGLRNPTLESVGNRSSANSGTITGASATVAGKGFAVGVVVTDTGNIYCRAWWGGNAFFLNGASSTDSRSTSCALNYNTTGAMSPDFDQWNGGSKSFAASTVAFKEGGPTHIQTVTVSDVSGPFTIPVAATQAGNLLVVGIGAAGANVTAVSDGVNSFTQAMANTCTSSGTRMNFWYLPVSTAGRTTITVTTAGTKVQAVFWEISGFTNPTVDVFNFMDGGNGSGGVMTGAPVTTTSSEGFIASLIESHAGGINEAPRGASSFNGPGGFWDAGYWGAASKYTNAVGTYTPEFKTSNGSFCSSTVSFKQVYSCASPNAVPGQIRYFTATGKLMYCSANSGWKDTSWSTGSACASPGKFKYNTSTDTYEYCNGTNWIGMKGGSISSCSSPLEGKLSYDSSLDKLKFCDGINWRNTQN